MKWPDIDFSYQRWGSWAIGFWFYTNWFGLQILMFKVVIQKHLDWDIKPAEFIKKDLHIEESE